MVHNSAYMSLYMPCLNKVCDYLDIYANCSHAYINATPCPDAPLYAEQDVPEYGMLQWIWEPAIIIHTLDTTSSPCRC